MIVDTDNPPTSEPKRGTNPAAIDELKALPMPELRAKAFTRSWQEMLARIAQKSAAAARTS